MKISDMRIKVESASQMRIAMLLLKEITGLPFYESETIEEYVEQYGDRFGYCVRLGDEKDCILSGNQAEGHNISFEDFMRDVPRLLKEEASTTVKLNEEYTAVITKDGVTVGCQTFPHSKILEVAERIKSLTK